MNRAFVVALTVVLTAVAAAQAPSALPGATYTIHHTSSTKADDGPMATAMAAAMPNGTGGWTGITVYAANRGRIDIVDGSQKGLFDKGDYILFDSAEYIIVHSAAKTFFGMPKDMGKRLADATAGAGGMAPKMTLSNLTVTLDTLGAGEVVAGLATEHYRLSWHYTTTIDMSAFGADVASFAPPPMVTTSTIDFLLVTRPDIPPNPFSLAGGMQEKAMGMLSGRVGGAMQELADKMAAAMKGLPTGKLAVRTTTAQQIGGGPGMSIANSTTYEISDVKRVDVDLRQLVLPDGFTEVMMPGVGELLGGALPPGDGGARWRIKPGGAP